MAFSGYLENAVLNHVFGGSAYTAPTTLYVGLLGADPNSGGTEPSADSYYRRTITFSVSQNVASNSNSIDFLIDDPWGNLTYCGVYDALTGGNLLTSAALQSAIDGNDLEQVIFNIGQINIRLT